MFYRPGGSDKAPNRQQDYVYADFIGGATDWLPASQGNTIAVNIARASIVFQNSASSRVTASPVAPEVQVILECKMLGGDKPFIMPVDQWQGVVVATDRRMHRDGWVRLRIVNINNGDGTGVAMALQINRKGDSGAVT